MVLLHLVPSDPPGLNAPSPLGASFSYHPSGWGKPPVDEGSPHLFPFSPPDNFYSLQLNSMGFHFMEMVLGVYRQEKPNYEEEPVDKTKCRGILEEKEEEEEKDDEFEAIHSVDSLSRFLAKLVMLIILYFALETADVIDDLGKQKKKEPERPLYQFYLFDQLFVSKHVDFREDCTLLGTIHIYVVNTGTLDKSGVKRLNLHKYHKLEMGPVPSANENGEKLDSQVKTSVILSQTKPGVEAA
ncbi:unnamed protein product [Sphenostylis stenocarpa]|uniref:Uncharacterized protein n=1 Tax=Sphenostylis stenocarpa TaxID=92480 RepID=A0AA86SPA5_9FABA|nr:unnamed protein product [Sphenostylis stenocarpa]